MHHITYYLTWRKLFQSRKDNEIRKMRRTSVRPSVNTVKSTYHRPWRRWILTGSLSFFLWIWNKSHEKIHSEAVGNTNALQLGIKFVKHLKSETPAPSQRKMKHRCITCNICTSIFQFGRWIRTDTFWWWRYARRRRYTVWFWLGFFHHRLRVWLDSHYSIFSNLTKDRMEMSSLIFRILLRQDLFLVNAKSCDGTSVEKNMYAATSE